MTSLIADTDFNFDLRDSIAQQVSSGLELEAVSFENITIKAVEGVSGNVSGNWANNTVHLDGISGSVSTFDGDDTIFIENGASDIWTGNGGDLLFVNENLNAVTVQRF